ncbi:hypothetical protein [uncultured Dubosiella sp.]|nr:hypothetical protein [uncultured Dubosiella sp.]
MPIWRLKSLINKEFEKNSNLYINSRHLLHLVELKTAEMRFFAYVKTMNAGNGGHGGFIKSNESKFSFFLKKGLHLKKESGILSK